MRLAGIELQDGNFPHHVGIIMDGNGRWAEARGVSRTQGHRAGMQTLKRVLESLEKTPVKAVTLYVFSKENWKRSQEELDGLFDLMRQFYKSEYPALKKRGVRILHSGDYDGLAADIRGILDSMTSETVANPGKILNLALNYSGRDELVRAARRLVADGLSVDGVDEAAFASRLDHPELADMDLVIRTSGELRISNFALWQSAYTEFHFADVNWPDFGERELAEALAAYQGRERRFGGRVAARA